jgi:hypothetical protein
MFSIISEEARYKIIILFFFRIFIFQAFNSQCNLQIFILLINNLMQHPSRKRKLSY